MSTALGLDEVAKTLNLGTREGFDTRLHLANAEKQASERGFGDLLIVDADAHHYESQWMTDIFQYVEDPVLRDTLLSSDKGSSLLFSQPGNQFNAGRLTRYTRGPENPIEGEHLDATRSRRQREAIGIDYQVVFPTPMLSLGLHPNPRVETALAWAYTRWWTEEVLGDDPGMKSLVYLPFRDIDASLRMIATFADCPGIVGFMVTGSRSVAVHHNEFMPIFKAVEDTGMPLGFHSGHNANERVFEGMDKFLSLHALGFVLPSLVHTTNLVINGIPERFPNLKIIFIESGLAWIPFLMQRLDNEYLMRTNEAPLLKKLPSEYMQDFYYTTQPMETNNLELLEMSMKAMRAETQLMFASDYPHWDFNLPSTVYDLPFLSEDAKLNILGRTALEVFPTLKAEHQRSQQQAQPVA